MKDMKEMVKLEDCPCMMFVSESGEIQDLIFKDSCVTHYITVIIVYVYVYLFCHAYVSEHSFVKWLRAYTHLYVISESSTQVLLMLSVVNQV